MTKWARFLILSILATPIFFGIMGFPVPAEFKIGLPGIRDQAVYSAIAFNFVLFLLIGQKNYVNVLTMTIVLSLVILLVGPIVRFFSETQESYSAYYVSKFINMLTVIPAALGLILTFPADELERKLLNPGKTKHKWRKAAVIFVRVIRHIIFQVMPTLRERILEEATPYHCIVEIWHRDRRAGRTGNAIVNISIFFTNFCIEIFFYALGASVKNAGLWAQWITQVGRRANAAEEF